MRHKTNSKISNLVRGTCFWITAIPIKTNSKISNLVRTTRFWITDIPIKRIRRYQISKFDIFKFVLLVYQLFQKHIVHTKFDIFEFVLLVYQLFQKRVMRTKFDILEIVLLNLVCTTRFWITDIPIKRIRRYQI
jgi:hypothetical protein